MAISHHKHTLYTDRGSMSRFIFLKPSIKGNILAPGVIVSSQVTPKTSYMFLTHLVILSNSLLYLLLCPANSCCQHPKQQEYLIRLIVFL